MELQYYPNVFEVDDINAAKAIILTDEGRGGDTESRWEIETPYLLELIRSACAIQPDMLVLDYGCGIGRMAKSLIDACGCRVIGVDISSSMLSLAHGYVGSDRFETATPAEFDGMVEAGLRVDAAISIWVLQHCFAPADDIGRIRRALKPLGRGFILNMPIRAIPTVLKETPLSYRFVWASDSTDVAMILRSSFKILAQGEPDKASIPNTGDAGAFWMNIQRADD